VPVATPPSAVIALPPTSPPPAAAPNLMRLTVAGNSPRTVIDLAPVFGARGGPRPQDGLQLAVLGTATSVLVRADLSAAKLILSYVPGQSGEATITVCATYPSGVSVQGQILVTVLPLNRVNTASSLGPGRL